MQSGWCSWSIWVGNSNLHLLEGKSKNHGICCKYLLRVSFIGIGWVSLSASQCVICASYCFIWVAIYSQIIICMQNILIQIISYHQITNTLTWLTVYLFGQNGWFHNIWLIFLKKSSFSAKKVNIILATLKNHQFFEFVNLKKHQFWLKFENFSIIRIVLIYSLYCNTNCR